MRIGIDCRYILDPGRGEQTGIGHYTYYLVKNLLEIDRTNEYVLFFSSRLIRTFEFRKKNVEIRFFRFARFKRYLPFVYSHLLISAVLEREKLDIYHSPHNIIPLKYKSASIITLHDLAIYKHPEWFPATIFSQDFSTKVLVPRSLERAEKIIVPSESTKRDVIELFNIPKDKIQVIYEGVEGKVGSMKYEVRSQDVKKKYNLSDNYILYLGTIEPRKNIVMLVKAFYNLITTYNLQPTTYNLAIAGMKGWKYKDVFKTIKKLHLEKRVRYLGYVSHEEKIALMKGAICFVFPSLYEGFGLPILEAMSLGAPVITTRVSSIPEVVGDAAILIDPYKENDLTDALKKVVEDEGLRKKLSQKGELRAKKFTWEKTARETLEVYKEVERKRIRRIVDCRL